MKLNSQPQNKSYKLKLKKG